MKKYNLYGLLLLPVLLTFATGCQYNKFEKPAQKNHPPLPSATHSIAELKKMYRSGVGGTVITQDIIIRGVISTNDTKGNFYRTMALQDTTGGIEVKMGMGNLSLLYPQGMEVAIKCQGLVLGMYGDMVNLGFKSVDQRYETGYIPDLMVTEIMLAGRFVGINPTKIEINQVDKRYANMLIKLPRVQFLQSELGQTYADQKNKATVSSVNRMLIDPKGNSIIVRTSSYAMFAGKTLPQGSGSVTALLSFFRGTPQLAIIDDAIDIQLNEPRF